MSTTPNSLPTISAQPNPAVFIPLSTGSIPLVDTDSKSTADSNNPLTQRAVPSSIANTDTKLTMEIAVKTAKALFLPEDYVSKFELGKDGKMPPTLRIGEIANTLPSTTSQQYWSGIGYYYSNNYRDANIYFRSLDVADAYYHLGLIFTISSVANQDFKAAYQYFKKAAALGHADAMVECAICLENGIGIETNREEAYELFILAAAAGVAKAQRILPSLILDKVEILKSRKQITQTAETTTVATLDYSNQIQGLLKQAIFWLEQAVKQFDPNAQWQLGLCYELGIGVNRDEVKALELFEQATLSGVERAIAAGLGPRPSGVTSQKHIQWFTKAREKDDPRAYYPIALRYRKAKGPLKDVDQALIRFQRLVKSNASNPSLLSDTTFYERYSDIAKIMKIDALTIEQLGLCYQDHWAENTPPGSSQGLIPFYFAQQASKQRERLELELDRHQSIRIKSKTANVPDYPTNPFLNNNKFSQFLSNLAARQTTQNICMIKTEGNGPYILDGVFDYSGKTVVILHEGEGDLYLNYQELLCDNLFVICKNGNVIVKPNTIIKVKGEMYILASADSANKMILIRESIIQAGHTLACISSGKINITAKKRGEYIATLAIALSSESYITVHNQDRLQNKFTEADSKVTIQFVDKILDNMNFYITARPSQTVTAQTATVDLKQASDKPIVSTMPQSVPRPYKVEVGVTTSASAGSAGSAGSKAPATTSGSADTKTAGDTGQYKLAFQRPLDPKNKLNIPVDAITLSGKHDHYYKDVLSLLNGSTNFTPSKDSANRFKEAGEAGNRASFVSYLMCLENGSGIPMNKELAFQGYEHAANLGDPNAMYALAVQLLAGKILSKDYKHAIYLLEKLVGQRFAKAEYLLGHCYATGKGVKKDEKIAVELFFRATIEGDERAIAAYGYEPDDQAELSRWRAKSEERGDPRAEFELAKRYFYGNTHPDYRDNPLPQNFAQAALRFEALIRYNYTGPREPGSHFASDSANELKQLCENEIEATRLLGICYEQSAASRLFNTTPIEDNLLSNLYIRRAEQKKRANTDANKIVVESSEQRAAHSLSSAYQNPLGENFKDLLKSIPSLSNPSTVVQIWDKEGEFKPKRFVDRTKNLVLWHKGSGNLILDVSRIECANLFVICEKANFYILQNTILKVHRNMFCLTPDRMVHMENFRLQVGHVLAFIGYNNFTCNTKKAGDISAVLGMFLGTDRSQDWLNYTTVFLRERLLQATPHELKQCTDDIINVMRATLLPSVKAQQQQHPTSTNAASLTVPATSNLPLPTNTATAVVMFSSGSGGTANTYADTRAKVEEIPSTSEEAIAAVTAAANSNTVAANDSKRDSDVPGSPLIYSAAAAAVTTAMQAAITTTSATKPVVTALQAAKPTAQTKMELESEQYIQIGKVCTAFRDHDYEEFEKWSCNLKLEGLLNSYDRSDLTAVQYVASSSSYEFENYGKYVACLESLGADMNQKTKDGTETALSLLQKGDGRKFRQYEAAKAELQAAKAKLQPA